MQGKAQLQLSDLPALCGRVTTYCADTVNECCRPSSGVTGAFMQSLVRIAVQSIQYLLANILLPNRSLVVEQAMTGEKLRHFDYLEEHGTDLEAALGLSDLSAKIDRWRRQGMEDPDTALVGCRKIVEGALKTLLDPLPYDRMDLKEIIAYARDEGKISRTIAYQCDEIRIKGNAGAHTMTVKPIDAKMTLELLDDFLRWCAEELMLIPSHKGSDSLPDDPIFIVKTNAEVQELAKKARIAAALDDNAALERKARATKSKVEEFEESSASDLNKMENLIRQAQGIGVSAAEHHDERTLAAQMALFSGFESKIEELGEQKRALAAQFEETNAQVQEILNEHDFINRLLAGSSWATSKQHEVMAFPRGANSTTNVLQIAGSAGTGKTLCLLAKLISEVEDRGQASFGFADEKKALFVCFNKGLATYVRGLLAGYEGRKPRIDVESYDLFVNQLVREHPRPGYEYLSHYAEDAKCPRARIIYSMDDEYVELLKTAQATIATRYPRSANHYYLNPSDEDGFTWLIDEISWIEARYTSKEEAAELYPKASRVGRGSNRRPSETIRRIILEIWTEFNKLLEKNKRYTIDQATKRLSNTENLPKYDAIAIDEVQDFSLLSIRLLLRFRRGLASKAFISGDENQKIYKRDFTWKELDEGIRGYTITLDKNMRNSEAIRRFSDRLLGTSCSREAAQDMVYVVDAGEERTLQLLRRLADPSRSYTTALITDNCSEWEKALQSAGISFAKRAAGDISKPGLYILGALMGKGLEFDNVVVDYHRQLGEDMEEEKRLRYVHFTRARRRLYIRYQGEPPELLTEYYSDFLA